MLLQAVDIPRLSSVFSFLIALTFFCKTESLKQAKFNISSWFMELSCSQFMNLNNNVTGYCFLINLSFFKGSRSRHFLLLTMPSVKKELQPQYARPLMKLQISRYQVLVVEELLLTFNVLPQTQLSFCRFLIACLWIYFERDLSGRQKFKSLVFLLSFVLKHHRVEIGFESDRGSYIGLTSLISCICFEDLFVYLLSHDA